MSEAESQGAEDALIAARRDKVARSRAAGRDPYANDVRAEARTSLAALRAAFAPAREAGEAERYQPEQVERLGEGRSYLVVGRLMARRGFGKASFLRLRDGSGELQLFAKLDVLGEDFERLSELDLGDHVEARGGVMVTKTGELSLQLTALRLLGKALRPLPDKWHGLTDVDQRYRRRYVDFVATPEAAGVLRARSIIVQGLRAFLDERGFLEVETPTLHTLVGGAAAKPFRTHHNALDLDLFLRIAPELYLKRLLVGGFERVYEIGRCYRNEGISTRHNPEFSMLEYYQAYATYETLLAQTEALLRSVDAHLGARLEALGQGADYQRWLEARPFSLAEPFARLDMREAVLSGLGRAALPAALLEELPSLALGAGATPTPEQLAAGQRVEQLARTSERSRRVDWGNLRRALVAAESSGERLFLAYEFFVEPFLAEDYRTSDGAKSLPVFILNYPFEVSPLARRKDADPSLTDRFELFVHGRELCNAFSELNDPDDQAARFRDQVAKKARGADETMDYDADYVRALEHGMPPAAGFGLGVDRLTMMLTSQPSIRDVIAFPLLRPETE